MTGEWKVRYPASSLPATSLSTNALPANALPTKALQADALGTDRSLNLETPEEKSLKRAPKRRRWKGPSQTPDQTRVA